MIIFNKFLKVAAVASLLIRHYSRIIYKKTSEKKDSELSSGSFYRCSLYFSSQYLQR